MSNSNNSNPSNKLRKPKGDKVDAITQVSIKFYIEKDEDAAVDETDMVEITGSADADQPADRSNQIKHKVRKISCFVGNPEGFVNMMMQMEKLIY